MKKITFLILLITAGYFNAQTVVTIGSATFDKGYMNAFNLDDSFAFGFEYPVADMKTTQTSTSVTLQPNFAIWTGEDGNAAWFDANPKTPNKYVEASSYTESSTAFNNNDLTFEGVVDVDDLDAAYTVNAFIKALDPNNGYATVVNKTVELTAAGQEFSVSATAAELTTGLIVQYGFSVVGPPADPANESTIGSVVVGEPATGSGSGSSVTPNTATLDKGYMNAFNLDDSFAFGFEYPVANMKTTQTSTSVTLQPNFAIWDGEDGNAAWFDANPKTPNKYVEASSYTESSTAFNDNDLTFEGVVNIDNLDEAYTVNAFIKALDPNNGYATVVNNTVELTSGGQEFSVSATAAELTTGLIVQYGFSVVGPPADPANESTLGSIVVGEPGTASTEDVFASKVSVYPNPANSFINISTTENISGVEVYNVIGKRVLQVTNVVNNSVDISSLSKGMYMLKIAGENSIATKKIIKN